jgi:prepilin-type N-terminal cleavage/methylation domain-containing protein/prepilin-type processing-associated H-X9-DG protein
MGSVARRRSPAFTLVELLVVITIIVVLAAIVIGVMAAARAAAAKAACANNLRQIGQGLVTYAQEFGRLPGSEGHKSLSDLPSFVDVLVNRQHFPPKSFICPASDLDRPSSYEMNFQFVGQPYLKGRADAILASESGSCVQCHEGSSRGVGHGSTANHLFFDGHVAALPKSTATPPRSPSRH